MPSLPAMDRQLGAAGRTLLNEQADLSPIRYQEAARCCTGNSTPLSLHLLEEVGSSSHLSDSCGQ